MNSKSNYKTHTCFDTKDNSLKCCNQEHCHPGHPIPEKSILACGQSNGTSIPIPNPSNSIFHPLSVASVTLDTTCLCNPSVKIDFNSIINYQALIGASDTLTTPFTVTFQLNKTCGDGAKIALGTWDYSFGDLTLGVNVTNSFGFTYCECNTCPACCVYNVEIVRVTGLSLTLAGVAVALTENAAIRSAIISATGTEH
ncbi:DUF4489 domain-containing protein [Clostridium frigidicarnis]|uniref:DUF4489 domain-containing protein n=1 Tax=Clostridium frigidicarnis TaxID=84698 RepID=A0A1I0X709_9CLOT|nr:DUF4489 domain-containing protein [Clostridium frigidicarnis]SFA96701.1 protein of unknown function [Clostridium frigidicarnis]